MDVLEHTTDKGKGGNLSQTIGNTIGSKFLQPRNTIMSDFK